MTRLLSLLLLLAACAPHHAVFSPAVEGVLNAPETVELLALHPLPHDAPPASRADDFYGYRVLGRAPLVDADARVELVEAVKDGVRGSDGTFAACFEPRHGLRFTRGTDTVELVICYECLALDVYGPGGAREHHTTISGVQPRVDRLFAGVGLRVHGKE